MRRANRFGDHRTPPEAAELVVTGGAFAGHSRDFVWGIQGAFGGIRGHSGGIRVYAVARKPIGFLGFCLLGGFLKTSRADPF